MREADRDTVLFDEPGDRRIWALGTTYKASFGADGFAYVPFFGSEAPKNYPVRFVLRSVRVGGRTLEMPEGVGAARSESGVTFDRGLVRELYELSPRGVEQKFVVHAEEAGDVDLEIEVRTELEGGVTADGLRFSGSRGHVEYGKAYVVRWTEREELETTYANGVIRLHVAAAQRDAGPVVIDPMITTAGLTATLMNSDLPDLAYDASTDRWGVVWVHQFSAADYDVVAELRTGSGDPIAGTYKAIDASTDSHSWPRIANLNSAHRFLIAMERYRPQNPTGQQYTVWGRTLDATSPYATSGLIEISPTAAADQRSVDVGGDSGTGARWTIVWVSGANILGRQMDATGVLSPTTIQIETSSSVCMNPQISLSNGNGLTPSPRWCIVYNQQVSANDWDVWATVIDTNGAVTKTFPIVTGATNDLYTYVSSPMVDAANGPYFLVSYERQGSTPEMIVKLVDRNVATVVPEVNMTRRFGFTGIYCRVESDGTRFAATCQQGTSLRVGTLALVGNDLVLHEAPLTVGTGASPHIASKRSAGGGPTDYGIAYTYAGSTPWRTFLGLYQGRAPAGGFNRRSTGCGLYLNYGGRPYVGEAVQVTVTNPGTDIVGLFLGLPVPAVQICPSCSLGVNAAGPIVRFPSPLSLTLPLDAALVGATLAVQGVAAGSGTCFGVLRLSDTVDFTIQ